MNSENRAPEDLVAAYEYEVGEQIRDTQLELLRALKRKDTVAEGKALSILRRLRTLVFEDPPAGWRPSAPPSPNLRTVHVGEVIMTAREAEFEAFYVEAEMSRYETKLTSARGFYKTSLEEKLAKMHARAAELRAAVELPEAPSSEQQSATHVGEPAPKKHRADSTSLHTIS